MSQKTPSFFLNIFTNDLPASSAFYKALGFAHIADWSDEKSASFTLPGANANVALMVHTAPRFKDFIRPGTDVTDPKKTSQALFSMAVQERREVDEYLGKAVEAGAEKDPFVMEGYGEAMGMYTRSFADLDGHIWEVVAMLKPCGPGSGNAS